MIFHHQPTAEWVPFDFMLLEAYQMLQDELCPKCGHPLWLCRSTSNNVEFKVREAYCNADRALREYEDNRLPIKERTDRKSRSEWGRFFYTVPGVPSNAIGDLPTREDYFRELAGKVE
jgi:hypothetical protein